MDEPLLGSVDDLELPDLPDTVWMRLLANALDPDAARVGDDLIPVDLPANPNATDDDSSADIAFDWSFDGNDDDGSGVHGQPGDDDGSDDRGDDRDDDAGSDSIPTHSSGADPHSASQDASVAGHDPFPPHDAWTGDQHFDAPDDAGWAGHDAPDAL